jgi:hypothetical protein
MHPRPFADDKERARLFDARKARKVDVTAIQNIDGTRLA